MIVDLKKVKFIK